MDKEKFYIHSFSLELKSLKEKLASISDKRIDGIVRNFLENVTSISNIGLLPIQLVMYTAGEVDFYRRFHVALRNLGEQPKPTKAAVEQEMEKLKGKVIFDDFDATLDSLNKIIDSENEIKKSFENLFRSNTVYLWTVFEALCHDLWELAINHFPSSYGKSAYYKKQEKIKGSIIKEFLENDFKIEYSKTLGSFLVDFYDFSGVNDISKSYKAAFGDKFTLIAKSIEQNTDLRNLQF